MRSPDHPRVHPVCSACSPVWRRPGPSEASKMTTWRPGRGSFAGIFAGEQRRTERRQIARPHAQIER